jgi:hypothetical protein
MIEIIVAIIGGSATVVAAFITVSKASGEPKSGPPSKPKGGLFYVVLFAIGAIVCGSLIHFGALAVENQLNAGGFKVQVGTIVAYMGKSAPKGWLICDGKAVSDSHEELKAIIGENTPDLRGRFLRGLDLTGAIDPDGKTRALGSVQEDELKSHAHSLTRANGGDGGHPGHGDGLYQGIQGGTGAAGGSETRPKNVAVNFIIKY